MRKKKINSIKLGVFVMAGLAFLILLLYVIGKNQNMFGHTFILKARFENVHGLMPGNNIRFAGIDAGTVKKVDVLNDTTIEVTLLIRNKMKKYIHKNATISIGSDGLMGNKLLNIESAKQTAPLIEEGDILYSTIGPDPDEMLKVLNTTNIDVAIIARELKQTVQRLNTSKALWTLLEDQTIPKNLRFSLSQIKNSSDQMNELMGHLNHIVADVKNGKGTMGELLTDTAISSSIKETINRIKGIGNIADSLSFRITSVVDSISYQVNNGKGPVNALLKNKEITDRFGNSLKNIEAGTQAFNENMEAIKHSFLFRGYYKKLERQKKDPPKL